MCRSRPATAKTPRHHQEKHSGCELEMDGIDVDIEGGLAKKGAPDINSDHGRLRQASDMPSETENALIFRLTAVRRCELRSGKA
jgi:hypothetical protein